MVNNYKRKATLIVLIVIAVTLALFPFVPQVFESLTTVRAATVSKNVTTSLSFDGSLNYQDYSIKYNEAGTYMIIAAGQNGQSYSNSRSDSDYNGLGATCVGFYTTTGPVTVNAYIGSADSFAKTSSSAQYAGGGST